MRRRQLVHSALLSLFTLLPSLAVSQPLDQPVRIIFPFAAGSSGDTLARVIAERLGIALIVRPSLKTRLEPLVALGSRR